MAETFLSDKQVAERYNIHRLTVRRWVREDETFPAPYKLSASCTRWKLSDLEAWEQARVPA